MGLAPSAEALCCVPTTLSAICLNPKGLAACQESNVLAFLVDVFTSKKYLKSVAGDCPGILGSSMDELMRHVPNLKGSAIKVALNICERVLQLGSLESKSDAACQMVTDDAVPAASETVNYDGQTILDMMNNCLRFLEGMIAQRDKAQAFVEEGGLRALISMFTMPKLPAPFQVLPAANVLGAIVKTIASNNFDTVWSLMEEYLERQLEHSLELLKSLFESDDLESLPRAKFEQSMSVSEGYIVLVGYFIRPSNNIEFTNKISKKPLDKILTLAGKLHSLSILAIASMKSMEDLQPIKPQGAPEEAMKTGKSGTDTEGIK